MWVDLNCGVVYVVVRWCVGVGFWFVWEWVLGQLMVAMWWVVGLWVVMACGFWSWRCNGKVGPWLWACGWVTMVVVWVSILDKGGHGGWVNVVVARFRWVWVGFLEGVWFWVGSDGCCHGGVWWLLDRRGFGCKIDAGFWL